jgi:tRNA(Arg) A34 adenosine deaminase TadA
MDEQDLSYLRAAIALAYEARARGQHPFGALVVADGQVLRKRATHPAAPKGTRHSTRN